VRFNPTQALKATAEQQVERTREPGAERADQVAHLAGLTRVAEAAIRRIEARERDEQHQRQRRQQPEQRLAPRAGEHRVELCIGAEGLGCGLGHGSESR
jgi:hypothetical protein